MKKKEVEKIRKISSEIDNFHDCYANCVLWGSAPDGDVKPEQILEWLTEKSTYG